MKKKKIKKVIEHLKGDIKTFDKEKHEDRELIEKLKGPKKKKKKHKKEKHARWMTS